MYNSLSLPNVYCTIKGVAVFIYSEEVKYCTCINHPVGDESSGLAFKGLKKKTSGLDFTSQDEGN